MDCLRIKLSQRKAHYRREESITNKMTYPLPPISTVIGALHASCSYTSYHPMDISIQGKYGSMQREVYRDHAILNSVMDDRGILVKIPNGELYNDAYHIVASALKSQGNSFRKNETIEIKDPEGHKEYCSLLNRRDQLAEEKKELIDPKVAQLKKEKNDIKKQQKNIDKKSNEFRVLAQKIKEIDAEIKTINDDYKEKKFNEYEKPYSLFKSLTTSIRSYEVLNDVELVLHIRSDEETLKNIEENINNFISLGRSEDFVEVTEVSRVELLEDRDQAYEVLGDRGTRKLSAYVPIELIENKMITRKADKNSNFFIGTRYYMNKDYVIKNKQRIFNKKRVLFIENYSVKKLGDDLKLDADEGCYVAFL